MHIAYINLYTNFVCVYFR